MSRMYCLLNVLCMPCSCRNVQGHGGGVPAEMFKENSKSDTLSAMDQDFDRLRGDVEFDNPQHPSPVSLILKCGSRSLTPEIVKPKT